MRILTVCSYSSCFLYRHSQMQKQAWTCGLGGGGCLLQPNWLAGELGNKCLVSQHAAKCCKCRTLVPALNMEWCRRVTAKHWISWRLTGHDRTLSKSHQDSWIMWWFLKATTKEKKMPLHSCHCSILRKLSRIWVTWRLWWPLTSYWEKKMIWSSATAATFNLKPPLSLPLPSQNAALHVDASAGAEASLRASPLMCPFLP